MKRYIGILLLVCPIVTYAVDSYYCPQNHAYINVGMTEAQVLEACGQPTSAKTSGNPVVQQIPVTQLIYTTLNKGAVYFYPGLNPVYNMFSVPSGSQGTAVQINLIKGQISSITLNGSSVNALSLCQGGAVQIGDSTNEVYNACGSPDSVNNTYINQPVPKNQNPKVWMYVIDQYQPMITLTFVNGILQSIN